MPENTYIIKYTIKNTLIDSWKNLYIKKKNLAFRINKNLSIIIEDYREKLRLPSHVKYVHKALKELYINKKPSNLIKNRGKKQRN